VTVIGIQVDEYRDGILIGTIRRDNMINITPLDPPTPTPPCPTSAEIAEGSSAKFGFSIYPNPTSGEFEVISKGEEFEVFVYDTFGNLVKHQNSKVEGNRIPMHNKTAGIYFYIIYSQDNVVSGKVILK